MGTEAHEMAKLLVELFKTTFKQEKVEVEILHDDYQDPEAYRVWGLIALGIFSFTIGAESFSLSLGLSWVKISEYGYAHQWIDPHTRRRKPTYRKISKFWEMVEQLKVLGYKRWDYDENPYSFTMVMYHPTPVQLDPPEARELLLTIIRKTITILREENPWAMSG